MIKRALLHTLSTNLFLSFCDPHCVVMVDVLSVINDKTERSNKNRNILKKASDQFLSIKLEFV